MFDTLVCRRGHSPNHHFLVLFLPITLSLAVLFDKESKCCGFTAFPASEITHFHHFPNFKQFQQTLAVAATRGRGKVTSLEFLALNWIFLLHPLKFQGWKFTAIYLHLSWQHHIPALHSEFLDFTWNSWISLGILGFHLEFLDFT